MRHRFGEGGLAVGSGGRLPGSRQPANHPSVRGCAHTVGADASDACPLTEGACSFTTEDYKVVAIATIEHGQRSHPGRTTLVFSEGERHADRPYGHSRVSPVHSPAGAMPRARQEREQCSTQSNNGTRSNASLGGTFPCRQSAPSTGSAVMRRTRCCARNDASRWRRWLSCGHVCLTRSNSCVPQLTSATRKPLSGATKNFAPKTAITPACGPGEGERT